MSDSKRPDRLYYYGTNTEVQTGDYVKYRGLLSWHYQAGRVSYLPEETAEVLEEKGQDADEWLVVLADDSVLMWLYSPQDLQPPKRLLFQGRATQPYQGLSPVDIEAAEAKFQAEETTEENLMGCLVTSLLVTVVLIVIGFVLRWLMVELGLLFDWIFSL